MAADALTSTYVALDVGRFLLDRIVDHTRRRVFSQVLAECSFALAELGSNAGVVGAARVAMIGLTG